MHLLKFRIIGHPAFANASWIEVGEGVNILAPQTIHQAQSLLHSLQAVNPPFDCRQLDPFADFPLYSQTHPYRRKIIPSKKTAAIAIYAATPTLVGLLAAIDPLYIETDRIEVGRRRDYSRWMNLVELPASARWSEIAAVVLPLVSHLSPEAGPWRDSFEETVRSWQGTDRIRGERADWLRIQLQRLRTLLPVPSQDQLDWCRQRIELAAHFLQAKALVATRLPLFYALPPTNQAHPAHDPLASLAKRLVERYPEKTVLERAIARLNHQWQGCQAGIQLQLGPESGPLVATSNAVDDLKDGSSAMPAPVLGPFMRGVALLHQAVYGCDPIFLLDLHHLQLTRQDQSNPFEVLHRICAHFQCLVIPDQILLDLCRDPGRTPLVKSARLRIVAV